MASAKPTYLSRIPRDTDVSVADVGARLLGLGLFKQGYQVAGVMQARIRQGDPLYEEVVVLMPRRATKTTSIWATLLGRCATIPGYRVVATAQDGTRAGEKIREHMEMLEANGFEESGAGELKWSNGKERVKFANGSVLWTVAPKPGAFRSAAADAVLFDEAGELDPEQGEMLLAGALPLMDTRDAPQVIITGTPSKTRGGLLWSTLLDGRAGKKGTGIVDYSLRDDEELVLIDDEGNASLNEPVLRRVHPGIGTLTTMARMRSRFEKMSRTQFEMEYGCRFPADSATDALDPVKWKAGEVEPLDRPDRVGIAFDCAYDGSSASIAYAWRLEDGRAVVELVEHRLGTNWVAAAAHRASEKQRRVPVAHDDIGANKDPAVALERMRPKPRIDRRNTKDVMGAAARFANEVHQGRLLHFAGQTDMDAAVDNLTWRDIGKSGRAFGQKSHAGAPINPVVSASIALWSYDQLPMQRSALPVA